jgi:hypothetical protein
LGGTLGASRPPGLEPLHDVAVQRPVGEHEQFDDVDHEVLIGRDADLDDLVKEPREERPVLSPERPEIVDERLLNGAYEPSVKGRTVVQPRKAAANLDPLGLVPERRDRVSPQEPAFLHWQQETEVGDPEPLAWHHQKPYVVLQAPLRNQTALPSGEQLRQVGFGLLRWVIIRTVCAHRVIDRAQMRPRLPGSDGVLLPDITGLGGDHAVFGSGLLPQRRLLPRRRSSRSPGDGRAASDRASQSGQQDRPPSSRTAAACIRTRTDSFA